MRRQGEQGTEERRLKDRFALSPRLPISQSRLPAGGFTLLELVITITILTILTLGAVPLVKVAVQRQKEQQLRETLREMRIAIDQFHREALAAPPMQPGQQQQSQQQQQQQQRQQQQQQQQQQQSQSLDPRIRVYISDQTLFTVDNPDRYPATLEMLTEGVDVLPFAQPQQLLGGQGLGGTKSMLESQDSIVPKKKVYLREIPVDPITRKAEWDFRSCYQPVDSNSWDGINVFDVRSKSTGTALNGEKYSDW